MWQLICHLIGLAILSLFAGLAAFCITIGFHLANRMF